VPLLNDLGRAIESGELRVHYQPLFSSISLFPEKVEALLRWDKYPICQVVEKLEQSGMIRDVTLFVIDTACSHMRRLQSSVGLMPKMAINIPPSLLTNKQFIDDARKTVEAHEILSRMIEFEITERSFVHDMELFGRTAMELIGEGFGVAIDDFGVGFSGLKILDMVPATTLKIDRHFIDGIGKRARCHEPHG